MVKRMLVDAAHPEETRVAVVSGKKLEEFDFETSTKKQLKGNIYLAKVTRVEPSLQASFIEYGGNRHGFLAFSEIHPDYYRIPVADREALIAAENATEREEFNTGANGHSGSVDGEVTSLNDPFHDPRDDDDGAGSETSDGLTAITLDQDAEQDAESGESAHFHGEPNGQMAASVSVETVGGDEVEEEVQRVAPASRPRRSYKIQEVIKRRQIMLVQVTKEERGNKGAALTTYLSLAGRYCVLMPNTPRGGGISRKISNPKDRKKMKAILDDLFIPDGMAVILRTAGMERTKAEIKRDLDYLLRLWDSIRETTLQSTAPKLIHEEANLIKRAERDLYDKEIEEILVAGEDGYRSAKDFMRMLMPSHAKKVQLYKDPMIPLFHRYQVESQIDALHSQTVQLRSGGYIVINPTEALVAIDVNSGRSTRERNIEETAYKTNLEAAEEIARQLRLRDLAGLIVIDFIDMEDERHNNAVERRLKECMRQDRARIQLGRISPFGLLELSRQRLRPSFLETHFETCRTCGGTGMTRSLSSAALHVLRTIEDEGIRHRAAEIKLYVPTEIALYILNDKRGALAEIEARYGFSVLIGRDDTLLSPNFRIEQIRARGEETVVTAPAVEATRLLEEMDEEPAGSDEEPAETEAVETGEEQGERRRRRSRRGRRRHDEQREPLAAAASPAVADEDEDDAEDRAEDESEGRIEDEAESGAADGGEQRAATEDGLARRKRRRGKRGGRRRSQRREDGSLVAGPVEAGEAGDPGDDADGPIEEAARSNAEASGAEPLAAEDDRDFAPMVPSMIEAPAIAAPGDDPAEAPILADVEQAAEQPTEQPVEPTAARPRRPRRTAAQRREAADAADAAALEAAAEPAEMPRAAVSEVMAPEVMAPELPARVAFGLNGDHAEPEDRTGPASAHRDEPEIEDHVEPEAEDHAEAETENLAARQAQLINQPPEKPRKGWWQRLTDG